MKKLQVTKERFEKSRYFTDKYGTLEYVSESGKLFKTSKGRILKFRESFNMDDHNDVPEDRSKLDNPEALIKFIRGLPDGSDYLYEDGGKWIATNEWLCGTFSGRGFEGDTEEEAVQKLIDYLNLHIGHNSMVGQNVTKSGWPIASKVAEYVAPEEEEVDESATPLKRSVSESMDDREVFESEAALIEDIFQSLGDARPELTLDFADNGREIYVSDPETNECFTITVDRDAQPRH